MNSVTIGISSPLNKRDAAISLLISAISGALALWWVHPYLNSFMIQSYGDQAWVQASIESAMQVGPFATNPHLGWPTGFDPWAFPPVGGVGFLTGAWLLGIVGVGSSLALALLLSISSAAMTCATYIAVRVSAAGHVDRLIAALGALAFGLSPYVLSKFGHFNVAVAFLLPATMAALGFLSSRKDRSIRLTLTIICLLSIISLASSLWWQLVVLYLLLFAALAAMLLRSRGWLKIISLTFGAVLIGSLIPISLSLLRRAPGNLWNREAWDSTVYSGSLTDFILTSPWLLDLFPVLNDLAPAASREQSLVGLIPMLFGLAALTLSLTAFIGIRGETLKRSGWLLVALQISLLTFLTLGLGTFTEAIAYLFGIESPLRVWSRLIILISLIGLLLFSPWISRVFTSIQSLPARIAIGIASTFVVSTVIVTEMVHLQMETPRPIPTMEEISAIQFLQEDFADCPVVQLPVGTFPDFPMADGTEVALSHYYRGFVPYLLNPRGYWSFGAVQGTETDNFLRSLPSTLTQAELLTLADAGYCAILFDQHYADWLNSRNLDWPGKKITGVTPLWGDKDRFVVFTTRPTSLGSTDENK